MKRMKSYEYVVRYRWEVGESHTEWELGNRNYKLSMKKGLFMYTLYICITISM
jgi:hypothetical protein